MEDLDIEDWTVPVFAVGRVVDGCGGVSPLFHLAVFVVSRPAARTARRLVGTTGRRCAGDGDLL